MRYQDNKERKNLRGQETTEANEARTANIGRYFSPQCFKNLRAIIG